MAYAKLSSIARMVEENDIWALLGGALDGLLINKAPTLFLIKNIAVPVVDKAGIYKMPEGLVYQAEGSLGQLITLYLFKK